MLLNPSLEEKSDPPSQTTCFCAIELVTLTLIVLGVFPGGVFFFNLSSTLVCKDNCNLLSKFLKDVEPPEETISAYNLLL